MCWLVFHLFQCFHIKLPFHRLFYFSQSTVKKPKKTHSLKRFVRHLIQAIRCSIAEYYTLTCLVCYRIFCFLKDVKVCWPETF